MAVYCFIGEKDVREVTNYLLTLRTSEIYKLGIELGLFPSRLSTLREKPDIFLYEVISAWLRRADSCSCPTYKTLVKALKSKRLGENGIADDICKDKKIY